MPGPWERYQSQPETTQQEGPWSRYATQQEGGESRPQQEGALRYPSQFAQGANQGLAAVAGAPFDIANNAPGQLVRTLDFMAGAGVGRPVSGMLEAVGIENPRDMRFSERPVGGSEQITDVFESAGFINPDDQPRNLPERIVRRAGEEVGATVIPTGATLRAGAAANAGVRAARPPSGNIVSQAVDEAAARPGAFVAADAGSSVLSGTGAAVGQEVGGDTGEIIGQISAPLAGFGVAELTRRGLRGSNVGQQQALDQAERAGTSLTAGQLSTTGETASAGGIAERVIGMVPGGNVRMARALETQQEEIGRRATQLADDLATGANPERAGRAVQEGIEGFVRRGADRGDALYSRVDELIPEQTPALFNNARRTAQEVLNRTPSGSLGQNATLNSPQRRALLESIAADEPRTYADLVATRTRVGELMRSNELIASDPVLQRLYGALSEDMGEIAGQAGPDAARAWQRANTYWRSYRNRVDTQLQPLLSGQRGNIPEQVFRAVESGGRDGATRLRALRSSVTDDEWNVVSSAALRRMGRARPGQQDELGEVFSTETFLTNWNNLDPGARDALFGGGRYRGLRRDLDAIAQTSARIRQARQFLANPSGTAAAQTNTQALMLGAGSIAAGNFTIPALMAGGFASSDAAARLMTNRRFVRWLAQSTKTPAERLPSYLGRLTGTVNNQDSQYAQDVQEYLTHMQGLIGQSSNEAPQGENVRRGQQGN